MVNNYSKERKGGYIALILVLIVSGITLLIAISANLLGISESNMGLQKAQSSQAFYLANLCAEEALIKLKQDLEYPGNETLVISEGVCSILPVEGSGNQNRIINTIGTVSGQVRKTKIIISKMSPKVIIASWQEVINF